MALKQEEIQKWGILMAVFGLATPWLLRVIVNVLTKAAGSTQAVIPITVTGIPTDFSNWLLGKVGIAFPAGSYIGIALISAVAGIVAVYIADALNQLKGTKLRKVATVLFIASGLGAVLTIASGIPPVWVIVGFAVNAIAMAWIITTIDNLIPQVKLVP